MHLHFERTGNTVRSDCTILSLTWMGKVPDESPTEGTIDDGWTLNRGNYYQEGWLASGNTRGIVGVTYTTAHTKKHPENIPLRTNYNLRGHRAEITLVRWNEPYQKLASCDSTGIIFVWIKYEGRWSIELINDRNTQVTDFAWSHNGRMALICYQDGFVLVGSVAGQRYWSSMLNLDCTISCGLWTPDDQNVYFGTTDGQIIVMDIHGTMLAQVTVQTDVAITGMAWSCEKFKLEEREDEVPTSPPTLAQFSCDKFGEKSKPSSPVPPQQPKPAPAVQQRTAVLATSFKNGRVYLMKTYDELSPITICTGLKGLLLEWSHSGELLAVAGYTVDSKSGSYSNILKFYTDMGSLRYVVSVPNTQFAVSALTWGHNDKRLFVATGNTIHIGLVCRKIASLQLMSRLVVSKCLTEESQVNQLPIPRRLKSLVHYLFAHTIRCYLPDALSIRDFASKPPPGGLRLHCTMIRHEEVEVTLASATNIGACYTLYLEYLGGLIPILKGKRNSKIRPEFIIFDPQGGDSGWNGNPFNGDLQSIKLQISSISNGHPLYGLSEDSDSDIEDSCTASPRLQRRRRMRRRMLREQLFEQEQMRMLEDVAYIDSLPEQEKLVEVTSNIWGTKFKIHGLAKFLPANLGSVTYKTSLLHLQPRQMTLIISELKDGFNGDAEPDPNFNPNSFSEDEDESNEADEMFACSASKSPERRTSIPIAPMTPNKKQIGSGTSRHSCRRSMHQRGHVLSNNGFQHFLTLEERQRVLPPALDRAAEDEYVKFFPTPEFLSSVSSHQSKRSADPSFARSSACDDRLVSSRNLVNQSTHDKMKTKHLVPSIHCNDLSPAVSNFHDSLSSHPVTLRQTSKVKTCAVQEVNDTSRDMISVHPKQEDVEVKKRSPHQNKAAGENRAPKRTNDNNLFPIPTIHWAGKTGDIKFIDDDIADDQCIADNVKKSHLSTPSFFPQKFRSHSIGGHLNNLDVVSVASSNHCDFSRASSLREAKKRLMSQSIFQKTGHSRPKLIHCGKSKSLDSGSVFDAGFGNDGIFMKRSPTKSPKQVHKTRPLLLIDSCKSEKRHSGSLGMYGWETCNSHLSSERTTSNSSEDDSSNSSHASSSPVLKSDHFDEQLFSSNVHPPSLQSKAASELLPNDYGAASGVDKTVVKSKPPKKSNKEIYESVKHGKDEKSQSSRVPPPDVDPTAFGGAKSKLSNSNGSSSPKSGRTLSPSCMRRALAGASSSILNSPLLNRRKKTIKTEISDDETSGATSDDVVTRDFKDLGSLQKAQLKQKLRKGQKKSNGESISNGNQQSDKRHQFTMNNKAPLWNESSQVYQLDFGGRVTQESAKNFQIEFNGKQVMQFGRIDGNAYTLDFQYPFTALQAFAVALANVTQRLK